MSSDSITCRDMEKAIYCDFVFTPPSKGSRHLSACSWRHGRVMWRAQGRESMAKSDGRPDSCSVLPSGQVSLPASPPRRQMSSGLFDDTVNICLLKITCLDANGLFLMTFQFLNVGFMFKQQHHLFVSLPNDGISSYENL